MPQIFSVEEKEKIRQQMLEQGFQLIKKHGMTHASVEKVTQATGIGRSTFYNFFSTKEKFIHEIICYQRDKGKQEFSRILAGRTKMTMPEAKEYLKYLFTGQDSIYPYLTVEDEAKLKAALPDEYITDIQSETQVLDELLIHMEGVKSAIDYEVVANLMKLLAITNESKELLHEDAIGRTLDTLFTALFSLIFDTENMGD